MPSSAQLTISTLTTAAPSHDIDDEEELFARGGGRNESKDDKDKELPPLKSVFDCKHLRLKTVNDGKDGWECGWCGKIFAPMHASRAFRHVLKIKKGYIALCKALIPDRYCEKYLALLQFGKGRLESKKRSAQSIDKSVALAQESSVGNLLKNMGGVRVSESGALLSSVSPFSSSAAGTSTTSARASQSMWPFTLSSQ